MGKAKVTIGVPYYPRSFEPEFLQSMFACKDFDWHTGDKHLAHAGWLVMAPGSSIDQQRNSIVREFLTDPDYQDAEWLLFFDTDQGCSADLVSRMVASADKKERPILSALIMALRADSRGGPPVSPACVALVDHEGVPTPVQYMDIPNVKHWRVGAAGAGCLLIHRTVLEAMAEKYKESAWPWFQYMPWKRPGHDVDLLGEDYSFCFKAASLGFPTHVDTKIECSHVKRRVLTSADFWRQFNPRELEPRNFVVIPTIGRSGAMLKRLLWDLEEQGGYDEIFLIDNGSTGDMNVWIHNQPHATVVDMPDVGIHEMWNAGVALARSRYPRYNVAFLNDDIKIGPNFLDGLADMLATEEKLVAVCPNWDERDINEYELVHPLSGIVADGKNPDGLTGFAFMVKSEVFDIAGYRFPTELKWWFGDNHFTIVMDQLGLWYGLVPSALVEHKGGVSGDWDNPKMQPQLAEDQATFLEICKDMGLDVTLT